MVLWWHILICFYSNLGTFLQYILKSEWWKIEPTCYNCTGTYSIFKLHITSIFFLEHRTRTIVDVGSISIFISFFANFSGSLCYVILYLGKPLFFHWSIDSLICPFIQFYCVREKKIRNFQSALSRSTDTRWLNP